MKIGVVVPNLHPNAQYRAQMPADGLAARGHQIGGIHVPWEGPIPGSDHFRDFDAVYFWQLAMPPLRQVVKRLNDAGIAVAWDSDDDITAVPKGAQNYRDIGGKKGQRMWVEMQAMIRAADAVTTPSDVLAEKFRKVGQEHVHVIDNFLPQVRPLSPRRARDEVVVGWVAGFEHGVDVKPLRLRETLERLLQERPNVHVETVGVVLELRSPRYRRTGLVQLADLHEHVARFDIGLAPLADIPFNRARSNIKLKEYGAVGVPWLASPVGEYVTLGERQGGRLVPDDRWFDALLELVDDAAARRQLGANAHAWARTQTLAVNIGQWERILEEAVARARSRVRTAAVRA